MVVLPGPLILIQSHLPSIPQPFISCVIVGEGARARGQRAGAERRLSRPGGAEEMLRICPVSVFSMWGGRHHQGTELSENVQLCSVQSWPALGPQPQAAPSRFSDFLGRRKAQEPQKAQKITSYGVLPACGPSAQLRAVILHALLQAPMCPNSHHMQKRQGDQASLERRKGPGEPSGEAFVCSPNYKRPPKALRRPGASKELSRTSEKVSAVLDQLGEPQQSIERALNTSFPPAFTAPSR